MSNTKTRAELKAECDAAGISYENGWGAGKLAKLLEDHAKTAEPVAEPVAEPAPEESEPAAEASEPVEESAEAAEPEAVVKELEPVAEPTLDQESDAEDQGEDEQVEDPEVVTLKNVSKRYHRVAGQNVAPGGKIEVNVAELEENQLARLKTSARCKVLVEV